MMLVTRSISLPRQFPIASGVRRFCSNRRALTYPIIAFF
jgi:hypothetical protein